jgi:hypothetical protein
MLDGSERWSVSYGSNTTGVDTAADGSAVYIASDGSPQQAVALDPSDGSELWTFGVSGRPRGVASDLENDLLYIPIGYEVSETVAVNLADQTEAWRYTGHSDYAWGVAASPDGTAAYSVAQDSTLAAIDPSDGSELWSFALPAAGNSVAVSPDSSEVYAGCGGGDFVSVAAADGTENNSSNVTSSANDIGGISVSADGSLIYLATTSGLKISDPSHNITNEVSGDYGGVSTSYNPAARPDLDVAGTISGAYFYDAANSQEVRLSGGLLTIDSMQDQDGGDVETTDTQDNGTSWDSTDMQEWVDYLLNSEEFRTALQENYDTGGTPVFGGGGGGDWWPPDIWPSWLPSDPLVVAIGAVAGVVGINVATS